MDHLYEGPLKTFKQLQDSLEETLTLGDAEKRFEEYKQEYRRRQAMVFFNEHKAEEWFHEKYHPHSVEKSRAQRAEMSRNHARQFFEEVAEGNLSFNLTATDEDGTSEGAAVASAPAAPAQTNGAEGGEHAGQAEGEGAPASSGADDEEGVVKMQSLEEVTMTIPVPSHLLAKTGMMIGPDGTLLFSNTGPSMTTKTLFVKTVPPQWSRAALLEVMGSVPDCRIVRSIFSEPNRFKGFHRLAWISYETEQQAQKVLAEVNGKKLKDHEILLGFNKPMSQAAERPRKPRITTPITATDERLNVDLKQARQLAQKLDEERGITQNPLLGKEFEEKNLTVAQRLDFFLVYLRQVHFYCYYCAEEFDDIDDLLRNCGAAHVRSNKHGTFSGTSIEKEWVTNLDNKIGKRISDPSEVTRPIGHDLVEKTLEEFLDKNVRLIEEDKFACALCNKLFKGPQFVKKHLGLKHPEDIEKTREKALEEQYFQNYLDDPRRILPSSILVSLTPPNLHSNSVPLPVIPVSTQQHILQQHKQSGQVANLTALVSAQAAAALAGLAAAQQMGIAALPNAFGGRGPGVPGGRFPGARGPFPFGPRGGPNGGMGGFDRGGGLPMPHNMMPDRKSVV